MASHNDTCLNGYLRRHIDLRDYQATIWTADRSRDLSTPKLWSQGRGCFAPTRHLDVIGIVAVVFDPKSAVEITVCKSRASTSYTCSLEALAQSVHWVNFLQ